MPDARENVIEVTGLTVGYDDYVILKDLNFSVRREEIFVILGGSGCGKSSTLKHMIGLSKPLKGDILLKGRSIVSATEEERDLLTREFGVLYQSGALFSSLTLEENIALPLREFTDYSPEMISAVAKYKLSLVGLEAFADFMPSGPLPKSLK